MTKILDYKNLVGNPLFIERIVLQLIKDGWHINGPLLPYSPDGEQKGLFVQCMIFPRKKPSGMKYA